MLWLNSAFYVFINLVLFVGVKKARLMLTEALYWGFIMEWINRGGAELLEVLCVFLPTPQPHAQLFFLCLAIRFGICFSPTFTPCLHFT